MMRRTGLQPMSAKRRAMLAASGVAHPSTTLITRKVTKPKAPKDTGPDDETVKLVLKRDDWKCCCCGDQLYGDRGSGWCIGHRKLRAQGVDNRPANLFSSCIDCERATHGHPERARQAGWMLKSTEDPQEIPMEHAVHGTVLLDNDGGFAVIEAIREEPYEHPF